MRPRGRRRGFVKVGNKEDCLLSKDRRYVFERSRSGIWLVSTNDGEPLFKARRLKAARAYTLRRDMALYRKKKNLLTHTEKHRLARERTVLERRVVAVIGNRSGLTKFQEDLVRRYLKNPNYHTVIHSDAVGVEAQIHDLAVDDLGKRVIIFPPRSKRFRAYCKSPFVEPESNRRTRKIVDQAGLLIAIPKTLQELPGDRTWQTVMYAREKQKPVIVIHQNELVIRENFYLLGEGKDGTKKFRPPTVARIHQR